MRPDELARNERARLVAELEREGISDERVLQAIGRVERHRFVPEDARAASYANRPLSIGSGQTISQPFIVAYMSELAAIDGDETVLEVGTGSGYQTAVLAELLGLGSVPPPSGRRGSLCSVEILPELAARAARVLESAGYRGIDLRVGDASLGCPERAPFDRILVTAAPARVPQALLDQLAPGGRLVIPVGEGLQYIELITRAPEGPLQRTRLLPVRFVPMTGETLDRE